MVVYMYGAAPVGKAERTSAMVRTVQKASQVKANQLEKDSSVHMSMRVVKV